MAFCTLASPTASRDTRAPEGENRKGNTHPQPHNGYGGSFFTSDSLSLLSRQPLIISAVSHPHTQTPPPTLPTCPRHLPACLARVLADLLAAWFLYHRKHDAAIHLVPSLPNPPVSISSLPASIPPSYTQI